MNVKKVLENIAAPKLAEFGFSPDKKFVANSWVFSRQSGNVKQFIVFLKSEFEHQAIRLELCTSLKIVDVIYGHRLVKGEEEWGYYTDFDSLSKVIEELTEIAIEYGLTWLELKSIPDLVPSKNLGHLLFENPLERAKSFEQRFSLNTADAGTLKLVEDILLARKTEINTVDWELILDASAYVGEVVRINRGGRWGWNEDYDTPAILEIGALNQVFNPLNRVARFWGKPMMPTYGLVVGYESLR